MKYNIRGDKLAITDAIRNYVSTKLSRLDKYFQDSDNVNANVLVKVHGNNEIIEVTIPTSKYILRAEEKNNDLYAAIDLATDKLERQIRKNKTRLQKRTMIEKISDFTYNYDVFDDEEDKGKIVKRKELDMKPMDEDEAILQMELLGHDFFVFKNVDTDTISVLYRKKDGDYGIILTK